MMRNPNTEKTSKQTPIYKGKTFNHYNCAAMQGEIADDENPIFVFNQTIPAELLRAIADGSFNIQELARNILVARGQNDWLPV